MTVSIERLMAEAGVGDKQARRMVRNNQLPGLVTKYGRYICTDGEFDKWLSGDWKPIPGRSEPAYRKQTPRTMLHSVPPLKPTG